MNAQEKAEQIVYGCPIEHMREGLARAASGASRTANPGGMACQHCIAAALEAAAKPSEAMRELVRWCEWEAMNEHTAHDDDRAYLPWTECPAEQCKNAHQRIAAVRKAYPEMSAAITEARQAG